MHTIGLRMETVQNRQMATVTDKLPRLFVLYVLIVSLTVLWICGLLT